MVFDFMALVIGLVMWGGSEVLEKFAPALANSGLFGCITIIVLSALSELAGLGGRVFWVPLWVWGVLSLVYEGTEKVSKMLGLSWLAAFCMNLFMVALSSFLFWKLYSRWSYAKRWKAAPKLLNKARSALNTGESDKGWRMLLQALVLEAKREYTPEQCDHLAKALDLVKTGGGMTFEHSERELQQALTQGAAGGGFQSDVKASEARQRIVNHLCKDAFERAVALKDKTDDPSMMRALANSLAADERSVFTPDDCRRHVAVMAFILQRFDSHFDEAFHETVRGVGRTFTNDTEESITVFNTYGLEQVAKALTPAPSFFQSRRLSLGLRAFDQRLGTLEQDRTFRGFGYNHTRVLVGAPRDLASGEA